MSDLIKPETSGITVPVTLIDAAGRKMTVNAPMGTSNVVMGIGPLGAFVFDKTDDFDPESLQRIYRQKV